MSDLLSIGSGAAHLYRQALATVSNNIAIGNKALGGNTSTEFNTVGNVVIGAAAGEDMVGGATYNTAVGQASAENLTNGDHNSIYGFTAATTLTTGVGNTVLGSQANVSAAGAVNQIAIGSGSLSHGDNIAVIGNSGTTAWHPAADNKTDLGSASYRFANLYTADIQLTNEGTEGNEVDGTTGNWSIQEGEDDLYLLNRKNGKKYKFKLEEIP